MAGANSHKMATSAFRRGHNAHYCMEATFGYTRPARSTLKHTHYPSPPRGVCFLLRPVAYASLPLVTDDHFRNSCSPPSPFLSGANKTRTRRRKGRKTRSMGRVDTSSHVHLLTQHQQLWNALIPASECLRIAHTERWNVLIPATAQLRNVPILAPGCQP